MHDLGLVVAEIERHVLEIVLVWIRRLVDHLAHQVAQIAFVLGLGLEFLAGDLDGVARGVVAHAGEFNQLVAVLRRGELGEVGRAEFHHDFFGGRVHFAHVGCVAEAERRG